VRSMIDRGLERSPKEKLIEAEEAAIRIAANEVDIHGLKICRRIDPARNDALAQTVEVRHQNGLHAVGKPLAHLYGPTSVRRSHDLARRVALERPWGFRQLKPEYGLARRGAGRIERGRLPNTDRRHRRQQAALTFIGGARHTVYARREVQKRDVPKVARFPTRGGGQRIVHLEIAFAVTIAHGIPTYVGRYCVIL